MFGKWWGCGEDGTYPFIVIDRQNKLKSRSNVPSKVCAATFRLYIRTTVSWCIHFLHVAIWKTTFHKWKASFWNKRLLFVSLATRLRAHPNQRAATFFSWIIERNTDCFSSACSIRCWWYLKIWIWEWVWKGYFLFDMLILMERFDKRLWIYEL